MRKLYVSKTCYKTDGSLIKSFPHYPYVTAVEGSENVETLFFAPVYFVTYIRDMKSNSIMGRLAQNDSRGKVIDFYEIRAFDLKEDDEVVFNTLASDKCILSAFNFASKVFDMSNEEMVSKIPEVLTPVPIGFVYSKDDDCFYIINSLVLDSFGARNIPLNEGWGMITNADELCSNPDVQGMSKNIDKIILDNFIKVGNKE